MPAANRFLNPAIPVGDMHDEHRRLERRAGGDLAGCRTPRASVKVKAQIRPRRLTRSKYLATIASRVRR
jgi:hypothetical protein